MSCPICDCVYTKRDRKPIACQYCSQEACFKCVKGYIETCTDVHCMFPGCKKIWTEDFQRKHFTKVYIKTELKEKHKKLLFEREEALLPETQEAARLTKEIEKEEKKIRDLNDAKLEKIGMLNMKAREIKEKYHPYNTLSYEYCVCSPRVAGGLTTHSYFLWPMSLKTCVHTCGRCFLVLEGRNGMNRRTFHVCPPERLAVIQSFEEDNETIRYYLQQENECKLECAHLSRPIRHRIRDLTLQLNEGATETPKERKEFIKKCPAEGCAGFLSTQWKCGLCDTKVCSKCLEIKGTGDHECKEEDVKSAEFIKKNSKACPKCGVFIHKTSGCSQMWCTECKTAFDWNTLKVITSGLFHNPHYIEWSRQTGRTFEGRIAAVNGVCVRPELDLILIKLQDLESKDYVVPVAMSNLQYLFELYDTVANYLLTQAQEKINQYRDNKSLRIVFLNGHATKDHIENELYRRYLFINKTTELIHIYEMFVETCRDLLEKMTTEQEDAAFLQLLVQCNWIVDYTNKALQVFAKTWSTKIPVQLARFFTHRWSSDMFGKFGLNCIQQS